MMMSVFEVKPEVQTIARGITLTDRKVEAERPKVVVDMSKAVHLCNVSLGAFPSEHTVLVIDGQAFRTFASFIDIDSKKGLDTIRLYVVRPPAG